MIAQQSYLLSQFVIAGSNNSPFAIATEVLAHIEAKDTAIPEATDGLSPIPGQMGLRAVFNHFQVMLAGNAIDSCHIRRMAVYVNRYYRPRARSNCPFQQFGIEAVVI